MSESFCPVEGVEISANTFGDILEALAVKGSADTQGVFRGMLNELEVTGTATPVTVATGVAFVKEGIYTNSTSVNVAIPTPTTATRIDRIVLRLDYIASPWTCTVQRLAGTEGVGAPALTQTEGTTWEISLAQVSITTAGVITVTDERVFVGDGQVVNASLADGAVTEGKIASGAVTLSKMPDGILSADAAGRAKMADGYVTATKMQDGACLAEILDDDGSGSGLDADLVDGYHASDIIGGGIIKGAIILWYGSLGGSDNHRPVVSGSPNEDWHVCNGETVNGITLPDLQGKFPLGASGTYPKGSTGGAATINLQHSHSAGGGGLSALTGGAHAHTAKKYTSSVSSGSGVQAMTDVDVDYLAGHTHVVGGNTDNALSTAQSIMPPYLAVFYICKVA